ncbi:branched-chain amino acid ABC transporter permease, partial [Frankia sp. Mgl5]|uniref:branched-chain amino acid ABC transporter permease n=1 Tax=Frankia sp. Mgl5 TaxID=2933793 RepID=UPI00200F5D7D
TSLAVLCAIASIGAIGLNILTGFTGQISIGVGAFLGVGGYTSAILTTTLGLSFWVSLPLAGIVTALVGALFGIPSLRLKGLYLAMATLAAQVINLYAMNHWNALTGGTAGMILSPPTLGSYSF